MKSLYTTPIAEWRMYAPLLKSKTLTKLLVDVERVIKEKRESLGRETIMDLIRKQAITRRVLQDRRYLQDADLPDFKKMMKNTHSKRTF